jgi:hypothetical protein
MINRLVLTAAIQLLTVPLLGIEALYAQKADPIAPAEPLEDGWESMDDRLLFLMTRLASVEASLEAVEKAISVAGGKKSRALADIRRADTGNELMDRKAGGPMKWSEFYGRTAEKFFYHPVDARTTYHTVTILGVENGGRQALPPHQRPPQLDYIYRANESVKARAEKEAAELGKKMDDLLARRRSLEEEQSGLWCEVAFRAVSRLDLPRKPLYRFELASASSEPSDGEKKEALNAALAFCQTAFSIVAAAESSQANAFGGIKKTIRDARERLDDAWVRKTGLASQIGDLKTSPGRFAALAKRLEDVSSNLADSYLVSIDGDRFKDEQRKDTFRGLLQHSLLSYAQITLALDEMATAMSKDWSIAPEIGKVAVRDGKIETRTATTQAAATEIGKPAATDREIPPSELPSGDLTSLRWLNTSYDTTLYHVEGKRWAVMDTTTTEVKSQLEAVDRTISSYLFPTASGHSAFTTLGQMSNLTANGRGSPTVTGLIPWDVELPRRGKLLR